MRSPAASPKGFWGRALPAAALALAGLVGAEVWAAKLDRLTTSQELAIGQTFAEAVDRQLDLLQDPVLLYYLNYRGRQLAARSERPDIPYFFRIVDSPEINAFAIPGGHIYINLGVFQIAEEEGELLGIVAHEIGHTVGRHGAEQILRQQWISIALTAAVGRHPDYYSYLAANLFGQLGFLKMSRDAERQADRIAFDLLQGSGYDPRLMIAMFERILERHDRNPGRFEKLFLTHPPTRARISTLESMAAAAGLGGDPLRTSPRFEEMKARVMERFPPPPELEEDADEGGSRGGEEEGQGEVAGSGDEGRAGGP